MLDLLSSFHTLNHMRRLPDLLLLFLDLLGYVSDSLDLTRRRHYLPTLLSVYELLLHLAYFVVDLHYILRVDEKTIVIVVLVTVTVDTVFVTVSVILCTFV